MTLLSAVPRRLQDWVQQLDTIPLPIADAALTQALHTLTSPSLSLREMAEQLHDSLPQALVLLRHANKSHLEPCATLEVAIRRLGINHCCELLRQQTHVPEAELPKAYRQCVLVSQHAAQQALGLFGARLGRLQQEVFWATALFLAPLWAMALAQPERMQHWEDRVLAKGQRPEKIELELFGAPLIAICQAIAEHWQLPDWIIQGYKLLHVDLKLLAKAVHIARDNFDPLEQQQRLDADRPLRRWFTQPANSILLANVIAVASHVSWDSARTQRWLGLTALYLQAPKDALYAKVHSNAADSARRNPPNGLWHPAYALLWPPHTPHLRPIRNKPPTAEHLNAWRKHCSELIRTPSPFSNAVQLTACARDALEACGISRMLLLVADRHHSHLQAQQIIGLPKECLRLSLNLEGNVSLTPWLTQARRLEIKGKAPKLPDAIKNLLCREYGIIHSVACNGRVMLLILADQGDNAMHPTAVMAVDKTIACISRALENFISRKTTPSKPGA